MENVETVNNEMRVNHPQNAESYEFRCPKCSKLYRVFKSEVLSSNPQFECQSCHALFFVNLSTKKAAVTPPTSALTTAQMLRLEEKQKANQLRRSAVQKGELKACPKCHTLNARLAPECYKCGIVFAKLELMAEAQKHGGLPSLVKMWQDLMQDYNNMTKHMEFVDRCEDMHALPFALKKYKELKEVQPQDSTAKSMFKSVIMKSLSQKANFVIQQPWFERAYTPLKAKVRQIPWMNLLRVSPLAIGFLLVLLGSSNAANRNFAGAGVALLTLILGFVYVLKGRISWYDFWL